MTTFARMSFAVVTLAAGLLASLGAAPREDVTVITVPAQLADDSGATSVVPRQARVMIGRREYSLTIELRMLLIATLTPFAATDVEPIQATVTLSPTDGGAMDAVAGQTLTLRGLRTTTLALADSPLAASLPVNGRTWTALNNRRMNTGTPHATVSFRARGKSYRVQFSSVQVQPAYLRGV